jgi:hypothetical protein
LNEDPDVGHGVRWADLAGTWLADKAFASDLAMTQAEYDTVRPGDASDSFVCKLCDNELKVEISTTVALNVAREFRNPGASAHVAILICAGLSRNRIISIL